MFKIGEFSRLTQVSIRMLRYYDETGLLKPAETDPSSGYRLYSTDQIPTLNKIIFLRDLGFQVAEITRALEQWNDESIMSQLDSMKIEIERNIQVEQEKLLRIELAKVDIQKEKKTTSYNVTIKSIPSYLVLSLRRVIPNYKAEGDLWAELATFVRENKISFANSTFAIYHDTEFREQDVDVEICAPVDRMVCSKDGIVLRYTEPVPIMACTMVYGSFDRIAGAYLSFAAWLQEHNQYRMFGQTRQLVHRGPWNEENPDRYLTEIQIPLLRL